MRTAFPPTVHMHEILAALEGVELDVEVGRSNAPSTCRRGRSPRRSSCSSSMARWPATAARYLRTPNPWQQDEERIERVMAARRSELAQMQAYMLHDGCYMEFLTRPARRSGRRAVRAVLERRRSRAAPEVDPERVRAAVSFLRRDLRTISPRLLWPTDAVPGLSGRITPPNEIGCALCVYGDAGWGRDVQRGKYVDGRFSRELVVASARAIRDRWRPQPEPDLGHRPAVDRTARDRRRVRAVAGHGTWPTLRRVPVRAPRRPTAERDAEQHAAAPERPRQARHRGCGRSRRGPSCWSTTSSIRAGR